LSEEQGIVQKATFMIFSNYSVKLNLRKFPRWLCVGIKHVWSKMVGYISSPGVSLNSH